MFKGYFNLLIPAILNEIEQEVLIGQKREWERPWLLRRNMNGGTATEFERVDLGEFRSFIRMENQQFDVLLEAIGPKISKRDTVLRVAIPAKVKLQVN